MFKMMEKDKSEEMARYYATTKDIIWDANRPLDTVNGDNVSKLVFSAEKDNEFDLLENYLHLPELRSKTGQWLFDMFGHECFLYMCWVVKYDTTNIGKVKNERSLTKHVDGGKGSEDLCAVVYTLHYGKLNIKNFCSFLTNFTFI